MDGGIVTISAPCAKECSTSPTERIDADNISHISYGNTSRIRLIKLHPPNLWSSTRPTKGEMYLAPAFADKIA